MGPDRQINPRRPAYWSFKPSRCPLQCHGRPAAQNPLARKLVRPPMRRAPRRRGRRISSHASAPHSLRTPPRSTPRRETLLVTRGLDRARKRQAPEAAIPTGRFPTLSAALQHLLENRDHTILFVEQCTADLRCRQTSHPLIGVVNCHEPSPDRRPSSPPHPADRRIKAATN